MKELFTLLENPEFDNFGKIMNSLREISFATIDTRNTNPKRNHNGEELIHLIAGHKKINAEVFADALTFLKESINSQIAAKTGILTPLHYAAISENQNIEKVKLLISKGADTSVLPDIKNKFATGAMKEYLNSPECAELVEKHKDIAAATAAKHPTKTKEIKKYDGAVSLAKQPSIKSALAASAAKVNNNAAVKNIEPIVNVITNLKSVKATRIAPLAPGQTSMRAFLSKKPGPLPAFDPTQIIDLTTENPKTKEQDDFNEAIRLSLLEPNRRNSRSDSTSTVSTEIASEYNTEVEVEYNRNLSKKAYENSNAQKNNVNDLSYDTDSTEEDEFTTAERINDGSIKRERSPAPTPDRIKKIANLSSSYDGSTTSRSSTSSSSSSSSDDKENYKPTNGELSFADKITQARTSKFIVRSDNIITSFTKAKDYQPLQVNSSLANVMHR